MKSSLLGALIVTGAIGTAAHATTYLGKQVLSGTDFSGNSVTEQISFSFTTDGSLGALLSSNFTGYLLTGSGGLGAFSIDSGAGGAYTAFTDTGFSATASQLTYDFDDLLAGDIFAGTTQEVLFFPGSEAVGPLFSAQSGNVVLANAASSVPEPSIWTLMIAGVAAIGGALRLRRKHRTNSLSLD